MVKPSNLKSAMIIDKRYLYNIILKSLIWACIGGAVYNWLLNCFSVEIANISVRELVYFLFIITTQYQEWVCSSNGEPECLIPSSYACIQIK